MGENYEDYTWKGDTWWAVDERDCPECGGIIGSNGKVDKCYDCQWWEVV